MSSPPRWSCCRYHLSRAYRHKHWTSRFYLHTLILWDRRFCASKAAEFLASLICFFWIFLLYLNEVQQNTCEPWTSGPTPYSYQTILLDQFRPILGFKRCHNSCSTCQKFRLRKSGACKETSPSCAWASEAAIGSEIWQRSPCKTQVMRISFNRWFSLLFRFTCVLQCSSAWGAWKTIQGNVTQDIGQMHSCFRHFQTTFHYDFDTQRPNAAPW